MTFELLSIAPCLPTLNDGVITKFKINNDLTSDFIVGELGL
jgi:hypothetical protein